MSPPRYLFVTKSKQGLTCRVSKKTLLQEPLNLSLRSVFLLTLWLHFYPEPINFRKISLNSDFHLCSQETAELLSKTSEILSQSAKPSFASVSSNQNVSVSQPEIKSSIQIPNFYPSNQQTTPNSPPKNSTSTSSTTSNKEEEVVTKQDIKQDIVAKKILKIFLGGIYI